MSPTLPSIVERARARHHRALVVLAGDRAGGWRALVEGVAQFEGLPAGLVAITRGEAPPDWQRLRPREASRLLGTGPGLVAVDLHGSTEVEALCVAAGAVRGGGLLVVLAPDLDRWADSIDLLSERLAPQPYTPDQVGRRTVARVADSVRERAWWYDVDAGGALLLRGDPADTEPDPEPPAAPTSVPTDRVFEQRCFDACRSRDQAAALARLEVLQRASADAPVAVVLTADRGRGKSSALGLAAHALQQAGRRVVVTGPGIASAAEVLARVRDLGGSPPPFLDPLEAVDAGADVLLVDEAATLSVPLLRDLAAAAPATAFATTRFGYEGTGMGFDLRFREHLDRAVARRVDATLTEPIRWAVGDPVEAWARHTFLLDAQPDDLDVDRYDFPGERLEIRELTGELLASDRLLKPLFGLLVQSHYRTTPTDLARMLDGPNVAVHVAVDREQVVGALLLAREGGLDRPTCAGLFEGRFRLRGNMLPETLTCHLAEEWAGRFVAWRVLRLAVHPAARRRGVGTHLLDHAVDTAVTEDVDFVGAGFAATPDLLRFWRACGFGVVRMAVTRSRISGEHSAVVLRPVSEDGYELADRLRGAFVRRFPHVLADALRGLEPEVALAAMRGSATPDDMPKLTTEDWNSLVGSAYGGQLYDATVQPAWDLARHYLGLARPPVQLGAAYETLLLTKVLQHRPWAEVVDLCGLDSTHEAMRRLRAALRPMVTAWGPAWVREQCLRFDPEER